MERWARYALFAGDQHYPRGGWSDFVNAHESVADAMKAAANHKCDWWQIVDLQTRTNVADGIRA